MKLHPSPTPDSKVYDFETTSIVEVVPLPNAMSGLRTLISTPAGGAPTRTPNTAWLGSDYSGFEARILGFDEFTSLFKKIKSTPSDPLGLDKMNANQRRKKERFLLKKWEAKIVPAQVKARLLGLLVKDAFSLAKDYERKELEGRRAYQAIQASGKVAEARRLHGHSF